MLVTIYMACNIIDLDVRSEPVQGTRGVVTLDVHAERLRSQAGKRENGTLSCGL